MRVLLCAIDDELHVAFREAFHDVAEVEAHRTSILDVDTDAIVSPANSFGYMDGGLDLVLSQHFGWALEKRVRAELLDRHFGELPVGQAIVVSTGDRRVPWLISAPTMRVPMRIADTTHAYLAFRAVLVAVQTHNAANARSAIRSVACPGLGTGEGRMAPSVCAAQMRYAWSVVVEGHRERLGGLAGAVRNHLRLLGEPEP
ncbi:MAG: macro domain-containing protein [Myxococcota bacterium]